VHVVVVVFFIHTSKNLRTTKTEKKNEL